MIRVMFLLREKTSGMFLRGQVTRDGFIDGEISGMDLLRRHDTCDVIMEVVN